MAIINVSDELYEHYRCVISARDTALRNPLATASEQAAILRATTDLIKEVAKTQQAIYNSETIAIIQQAIIEGLDEAAPELKLRVIEALERRLKEIA